MVSCLSFSGTRSRRDTRDVSQKRSGESVRFRTNAKSAQLYFLILAPRTVNSQVTMIAVNHITRTVDAARANSHIETPHDVKIGLIHDDQAVHAMVLHTLPRR